MHPLVLSNAGWQVFCGSLIWFSVIYFVENEKEGKKKDRKSSKRGEAFERVSWRNKAQEKKKKMNRRNIEL